MILLYLFLFIIGACFGSFTNVLIDRLPRKKSLFHPPSHCDSCHKKIQQYDLIPVLSFLLLRGKCRYCKHRVPLRVFFVELLCGLFAVYLFLLFGILQALFIFLIFIVVLAISLIDLYHGIIPDELLITLVLLSLCFILLNFPLSIFTHLLTGVIAFLFFFSIFLLTRQRGMGFGDVKYAFCIGFLLSPMGAVSAFYISFLTGAAISILLVVGGVKKLKGSSIPFGPFLSLGFLLTLLFSEQIFSVLGLFL